MAVKVIRAGMQTTVQDLGRRGHRVAGVPLSGAMDPVALRVANSLVGNAEDLAALEFVLLGPTVEFTEDALVAIGGAEVEGVRSWRPLKFRAGERLVTGACQRGCRGYLAVAGGFDVPLVLGSPSTYLRGGWGGFEGRALRDGDRLPMGAASLHVSALPTPRYAWQIDPRILPDYSRGPRIRATRARGATTAGAEVFQSEYTVTAQSDRMGLRLRSPVPLTAGAGNALSAAVTPGTVQVPPDGQPVVLMADAQTIGGYPPAAHVICVDLPLMAQLRPGDRLRFTEVTLEEAHRQAVLRERSLAILRQGLAEKLGARMETA